MALFAFQTNVSAIEWEICARIVVEGRIPPIHFIVAHLAVGRKFSCRMRWIGRGVIIFQVTGDAFRVNWVEPKS